MSGEQALFGVFALAACASAIAVVVSQNVVRMAFWLVVSLGSVAGLFFLLEADFVAATQILIYVGGTVVLLVFGVMLTASGPYLRIATSPAEGLLAGGVGLLLLSLLVWSLLSSNVPHETVARAGYESDVVGGTARPLGTALLGLQYSDGVGLYDSQSDGDAKVVSVTAPNPEAVDQPRPIGWTVTLDGPIDESVLPVIPADGSAMLRIHNPGGRQASRIIGVNRDDNVLIVEDAFDSVDEPSDFAIVQLKTGYLLPFEIVSIHLLVVLIGAAYLARAKRRVAAEGEA